jgi:ABC-type branched-subunit amino acid transport system ATPase component
MAARPRVILLDEALAGMSTEEIAEVRNAVGQLREWGVEGVVSVEHVLSAVRDLADRMVALDFGRVIATGSPDDVLEHEAVVTSYLGAAVVDEDHPAAPRVSTAVEARDHAMRVDELVAGYGNVRVLWDVAMGLSHGEFIGVLGASGAGKTTLCRALTGGCAVHGGRVQLGGDEITGRPAHVVARMGVAHVPSSRELFPELEPLMGRRARTLSGGQQQMVAIGRALMREPKLLILDEPSTGLAPIVVRRLMEALRSLAQSGVGVMVVEQNAVETLRAVDRAYVLQEGRIVFSGSAEELRDDARLASAYLGAGAAPS